MLNQTTVAKMKRILRKAKKRLKSYLETRFPKPMGPRHVEVVHPADSRTQLDLTAVREALARKASEATKAETSS